MQGKWRGIFERSPLSGSLRCPLWSVVGPGLAVVVAGRGRRSLPGLTVLLGGTWGLQPQAKPPPQLNLHMSLPRGGHQVPRSFNCLLMDSVGHWAIYIQID